MARASQIPAISASSRLLNLGPSGLKHGDALALNADTRLPDACSCGFIGRAVAAKRRHCQPAEQPPATASYPRPFRRNAFDEKGWTAIDLAAARCGEGRVIDIPSATGFCMYVTRACLDAVGGLSEAFGDGYLEDAEFGLRAREAGYRNVCALSVYAPHLGSRSFKSAKKALVARNRVALAWRFPEYEAECDAFLAADPLARSRAKLEMALASESPKRRLIVGPARWRDACDLRADQLAGEGVGALVALVGGQRMTMRGHGDAAPQNVEIEFARDGAVLADALKAWPFDRIEYLRAADAPEALRQALDSDLQPLDIVLAIPPLSARDIHTWPRCETFLAFDAMAARACQALGAPASRLAPRIREAAGAPRRIDLAILHPFETSQSRRFLVACADALAQRRLMALLIGGSSAEEGSSPQACWRPAPCGAGLAAPSRSLCAPALCLALSRRRLLGDRACACAFSRPGRFLRRHAFGISAQRRRLAARCGRRRRRDRRRFARFGLPSRGEARARLGARRSMKAARALEIRAWRIDRRLVAGYAVDFGRPERSLVLEAWLDGAVAGATISDLYCEELAASGLAQPRHGFAFSFAPAALESAERLEIRVANRDDVHGETVDLTPFARAAPAP